MKDPKTILVYEGQRMAERHMADQVTLISPQNEAITIQMDVQTHLPLTRSFKWRDPFYKDKNTDVEEYADYHDMEGCRQRFRSPACKNDEMVRQVLHRQGALQPGAARLISGISTRWRDKIKK